MDLPFFFLPFIYRFPFFAAPFLRIPASLMAMAIAWRRLVTLGPVLLPACRVLSLNSCMTAWTFLAFSAFVVGFFGIDYPFLPFSVLCHPRHLGLRS